MPDKIEVVALETDSCPTCKARRPIEEIKHAACGNCQDLKAREEAIKNQESIRDKNEEHGKKLSEDLKNLPDLDNLVSALYDNERGVWWLGINLKGEEVNPLSLMVTIDQTKLSMIAALNDWQMQQKRKESLIVRVGDAGRKIKEKAQAIFQ